MPDKSRKRFFLAALIGIALLGLAPLAARAQSAIYPISGTCDGLPRIDIPVAAGYCLGLVAEGLKFPRGLLPLADGRLLVAEMMGWGSDRGRLTLLTEDKGRYRRTVILRNLRQPHGLVLGPDNRIYVGILGGVKRFALAAPQAVEDVIGGASGIDGPPGDGRHPLTSLVFTTEGDLVLNVGSASNNCEDAADRPPIPDSACAEGDTHGLLRLYRFSWPEGKVKDWSVLAWGLRNSIGLAVHPRSGILLQTENSRDDIDRLMPILADDEDLPPDEINLIEYRRHYGWPYCYGANLPSPEYPDWDCSTYRAPRIELPAHSAPLGLAWWDGRLFVGYHGYRRHGHRLVAYETDAEGKPIGVPQNIVAPWDGADGSSPPGAPVDLKVGPDGALYISEDRNGTILRLTRQNGP